MPAKYDLTWDGSNRRWRVMYRGRRFVVSCRQLGTVPTKEGSYLAANEWWRAKQVELENIPREPPHPHQAVIDHLDRRIDWARRYGLEDVAQKAEAGRHMALSADEMATADVVPFIEMNTGDMSAWSQVVGEDVPADTALKGLADRYLAMFVARHRAGALSVPEVDITRQLVGKFVAFIGPNRSATVIDARQWEGYWTHLMGSIAQGKISPVTAKKSFAHARRFVQWLAGHGAVVAPGNLQSKSHKFPSSSKAIPTFSVDEAVSLVNAAPGQLKLHLFLMLNCGFTQSDIASLLKTEIDLEGGRITRQRSKTRQHHGDSVPTVTWVLWPETLVLLRRYRSDHPALALTTANGKPWVEEVLKDGKRLRRDGIDANFRHIRTRLKIDKSLKVFRKTSSSKLDDHPEFGRYAQFFLAQAPDSVAARHYVRPSQEQFDLAVAWLRTQYHFS